MAAHELAILWGTRLALLVALAGLISRDRVRQCYAFVGYVVIVLVCGTLMALWPERFWTPQFFLFRQALYDAAKLVLAVELAWRMLRAFPGAMRTAQRWAMVLLPFAVLAVVGLPAGFSTFGEWQPKMMAGSVALFTLTAFLTLWYHLPVRPWHRALLIGFAGYLFVFNVLLEVLRTQGGWAIRSWFNLADGVAYFALVVWWAVEAWRPDPVLVNIPLSVQRRLGLADPEHA